MKQRKLVIGLLVMLAVAVSGFTFAYWAGSVSITDEVESTTVTIGEARSASVTAVLVSGSGTLVPIGELANSAIGSVESITYTFTVDWDDNLYVGGTADLDLVFDNFSNATAEGLLNFAVTGSSITEGSQLDVTIVVTLTAPADVTEYNAIITADVTFDITFNLSNLQAA
jgi:hypothetical protein